MHSLPSEAPRRSLNSLLLTAFAAVAAIALVIAGFAVLNPPALAASSGVGWGTFGGTSTAYKGTFNSDGNMVVCAEAGRPTPTGQLNGIGTQGTGWINNNLHASDGTRPSVSDDQLAGINRVLNENVGTGDKNTAAALEYAVRAALYPSLADLAWNGSHKGSMNAAINYDLYSTAGSGNVGSIQSIARDLLNTINSTTAGSGSTGSGFLSFVVDQANNFRGTVTMVGTSGAVGTITLTNGIFLSTGTNTLTGATAGVAYDVTGVPPTEDGARYKISGTGSFTAPGQSGYAAEVSVFQSGSGQQTSIGMGGMATNQPFTVNGNDPDTRGSQFLPVVATTATTYIQPGEQFTDTLTFSTAADASGTNNPWFKRASTGQYAPVTARGTVYGPFPAQPAQSATVPADAPIAGAATVTTTGADGPNVQYTATSDTVAASAGFYTWVWSINWADQDKTVTQYVIPGPTVTHPNQTAYSFTDAFGQVVESHIVPSDITATSQVTAPSIPLSGESNDTIVVSAKGYWNQAEVNGKTSNIPVVFRGTAYFVPGTDAPVQQAGTDPLPADVVSLGSTTLTVTEPGTYTPSKGLTAPPAGVGHITWVWKIDPADQDPAYAQMVRPWTSDFGIPSETQLVDQPTVATKAQPGTKAPGTITDTATVGGVLPVGGATLSFELYRVPVRQDSPGHWVTDTAASASPSPSATSTPSPAASSTPGAPDLSWVCTDENRVYSNVGDGQLVTAVGEYTSPEVLADQHGKYLWVESLWSVPTNPGDKPQLISKGVCGLLTETTFAVDVTTKAKASDGTNVANYGEELWDTAKLTGYVPEGGSIEFQVHQTKKGEVPVCTDANLLTTLRPVDASPLEGGFYDQEHPLEVVSERWKNQVDYDSDVYFVEVTKDSMGRIVSQGECGDTDETVAANAAVAAVARTDGSIVPLVAGGAAALILIGLGVILVARRRKVRDHAE